MVNGEEITNSDDLEFLETFNSANLPEADRVSDIVRESIFKFIPEVDAVNIKAKMQYQSGITFVEPNRIEVRRSEIEAKILDGKYEFNMEIIKSITIEEVVDGEYNVHIVGGEQSLPIDLEIGTETSSFQDIPPGWLLQKS